MTRVINLDRITFAYPGQRPVLRDVSLEVMEGDFLVMLGPNGAAKTTLLRIMLGLLKPQQGTADLPVCGQGGACGYIPQKATGINPGFPATVEEVVALNTPLGSKLKKRLVEESIRKAGLWEKRACLLGTLSGGQFQRVMIARALISSPRILFLDEPFTGLDTAAQAEFLDLLRLLNREGLTILLVTHDPEPLLEQANRFLLLRGGHLEETDPTNLKVVV